MEEKFYRKYYLIFFSTLLGPMTTNSLVPIFEELRINFNLPSIAMVSLAITVYIFPFAIFQLFAGTFSDIIDKKQVVVGGFFVFIAGLFLSLIAVLTKVFLLFLLAFFIQGIGFAFINPTVLAILSIISPERKKGLVMGIYVSFSGLGVSLGAFLSGFLATIYSKSWRLLFVINPVITIVSLIFIISSLKNCEPLVCRSFETHKKHSTSRLKATLHHLRINFTIPITLLGAVGFSCFFVIITLTNTLNQQIRIALPNLSNQEVIFYVTLILTVNGIISIILAPITGFLLKKINPVIMILIGFGLMLIMTFMPLGNSIIDFMLISFFTYIGSSFVWPALFQLSLEINPNAKGTNSAIINSLRFLGYALVGPIYIFLGIPIIYGIVTCFILLAIVIILIFGKLWYKEYNRKLTII